jgi:hypothetical protein
MQLATALRWAWLATGIRVEQSQRGASSTRHRLAQRDHDRWAPSGPDSRLLRIWHKGVT